MAFCKGCGNEVPDPGHCPICLAGRGAGKGRKDDPRCFCPRCEEALEEQDWEGTTTLSCPVCRGTFFPGRALEQVLNRLRATVDTVDAESVLRDFRDRFTRQLPEAVRYKACPVCSTVMTRRNYATVSGVIVDFCGDHGMWVDEAQFADLASFICRGGDILASQAKKVQQRASAGRPQGGEAAPPGGLLDRLFRGGR